MAKIVIIDDDPSVRSIVVQFLRRAGHAVEAAANGKTGMARLRNYDADLVITDLVMPEMEGIETILRVRREFPGLKIVAMSGAGKSSEYLKSAKLLGAHVTLAKPFTAEGLLATVNSALMAP